VAYAIESEEAVGAAIVRVMREQIERARTQLTDEKAPIEKRVHDARKRFKETRALLRLVQDPVENAAYRDAGRTLAGARDAEAVLEALQKLAKSATLPPATLRRTRRLLKARRNPPGDVEQVLAHLQASAERLDGWPSRPDSFDTIADGLKRTYRDGRRAMHVAAERGMPEDYHEWRKRVKEHWYHAQLLRHVWPDVMKAYAATLETLSRTLGDHHDLTVLRQIVVTERSQLGRRSLVVALIDAIDARQQELAREAQTIGARVYAESPRRWLARMWNYWTTWRARSSTNP
jgi:CHAD domain-containing protein